ncbi:MAG: gamma-glutamyltransferase family protein [Actinomycetota bacterium]|nr:gamma-glutamyltransferase family protein [Actinomycetota bacterium]
MGKPRLGIAAGNRLGAEAATQVAQQGGNAVDACLAAAIMAWVAEPFFSSVGGSGFVAVRAPDSTVEVVDGNNTMPTTSPAFPGQGLDRVYMDYSNGMYTGVGAGSIAVPGILAAARVAWERHGSIEWDALFAPAIEAAETGLPFPLTSAYYLSVTWDPIWMREPESRALFERDGRLLEAGDLFVQPELAEALREIATRGPEAFYSGSLAEEIEREVAAREGFLCRADLTAYQAEVRAPIATEAFGWKVESNPPPAVGGAVLAHMLALLDPADLEDPRDRTRAIVEAQRAAVGYRRERYLDPSSIAAAFEEALAMRSPSTTHSSAADSDGYVCAITESNGYGAGIVVHGMLLNNTLGEEELNPLGVHRLPPGSRCHSNMAPTIATGPDRTVGLGSPGADRIVSSIAQTFVHLAVDGDSLAEAVAAPRAHLDPRPDGEMLCYEPGLPGEHMGYRPRPYDDIHMYFGAVQAASVAEDGTVDAAHDRRRSGGSALV